METKTINNSMSDMVAVVAGVCINCLSMTFIIGASIWCINKVLEAMFGFGLIPAR